MYSLPSYVIGTAENMVDFVSTIRYFTCIMFIGRNIESFESDWILKTLTKIGFHLGNRNTVVRTLRARHGRDNIGKIKLINSRIDWIR